MPQQQRTNLNLLPVRYRRWVLVRASIATWAVVWLVGIVAGCVLVWRADSGLKAVHEELSKFQRMNAPPLVMQRELHEMRRRLTQVQAEEQAAAYLEDDRPALALLGVVSHVTRSCSDRLHVRECSLEPRRSDRGALAGEGRVFSIKGATLDLQSVYQLQSDLRDAGMFDRVQPQPTTSVPLGDQTGFVFHVECFY